MTGIQSVQTGLAVLPSPTGAPAPGSPAWITVRPDVRRGAAVAADLLAALGKDLAWHGKGRNENEDLLLARAWIHALDVGSLVVANAQEAPLPVLDTLRELATHSGIGLWLLHRSPIDDRTHRKITRMARTAADLAHVPAPIERVAAPAPATAATADVPAADFPSFLPAMLADPDRYADALTAYDGQIKQTGAAIEAGTGGSGDLRAAITKTAGHLLRSAPDDGRLIARLRALQVLAWRNDLFLGVDATTVLASTERPRSAPGSLDERLLSYRQPQRAIATALTIRGIDLDDITALTLHDVQAGGTIGSPPLIDDPTDAFRLAARAQRRLRELQGATDADRLLCPDAKTLARFVNDATADLGLNIAGRRVERQTDPTAWLKRLGITLRDL
jgi:hypothetical protein